MNQGEICELKFVFVKQKSIFVKILKYFGLSRELRFFFLYMYIVYTSNPIQHTIFAQPL